MGDPRKLKNKFDSPKKPWDKKRLDEERELSKTYGLKSKKELWRVQTILRNKRQNARKLLALPLEERVKREKELMDSLNRMGLLKGNASLDDVLSLNVEELLERRLQTMVWRKDFALTPNQSRQFIVHGHIAVNGKKVNVPSYLVSAGKESSISYFKEPMVLKEIKKKAIKQEGKEEGEKEQIKKEFDATKPNKEAKIEVAKEIKETPKEKTEEVKEKKTAEGKKEESSKKKKEIKEKKTGEEKQESGSN